MIAAPGRDFSLRRFAFLAYVEQNSASSLRKQGPITTGARCYEGNSQCALRESTAYGSLLSQGRQQLCGTPLSPQRALRVHVERIDRLARSHSQPVARRSAATHNPPPLPQSDPPPPPPVPPL